MIHVERLNKPAVALCNEDFMIDARSGASSQGMPTVRLIPETVPCECSRMERVEAGVSAVINDVVAALTKPLTDEEKSPSPKEVEELPRIVFQGSLEEVNQFFYRRGWADGLPIIPPTEEAVKEMLTGTDLPPDHVVAKIIPRYGKATVEKIAINAVMAGALPTYMPLLIAAVQAVVDPRVYLSHGGVSTGCYAPMWIINGPVRNDLNIRSGTGALSPGDIANAAIGRAMGLIIKNIGGQRKCIEDMAVFGTPGKYTMVIAEREEDSPWEPMHVEHGFNKEDSTVTVFFPNCLSPMWPYSADARGILDTIIYNIPPQHKGLTCIMLPPGHANSMADEGWTKKAITKYVAEYARVPAYRHSCYRGGGMMDLERQRPPANPEDSMSIFVTPAWLRVLVCGGPGNTICFCHGGPQGGNDKDYVTKKVDLPANWDKLVAKYKNLVPTYVQY